MAMDLSDADIAAFQAALKEDFNRDFTEDEARIAAQRLHLFYQTVMLELARQRDADQPSGETHSCSA